MEETVTHTDETGILKKNELTSVLPPLRHLSSLIFRAIMRLLEFNVRKVLVLKVIEGVIDDDTCLDQNVQPVYSQYFVLIIIISTVYRSM